MVVKNKVFSNHFEFQIQQEEDAHQQLSRITVQYANDIIKYRMSVL